MEHVLACVHLCIDIFFKMFSEIAGKLMVWGKRVCVNEKYSLVIFNYQITFFLWNKEHEKSIDASEYNVKHV